jgi:hypothetical protein
MDAFKVDQLLNAACDIPELCPPDGSNPPGVADLNKGL